MSDAINEMIREEVDTSTFLSSITKVSLTMLFLVYEVLNCFRYFRSAVLLVLFWTGGFPPPPAVFLNAAQKPLGLGS